LAQGGLIIFAQKIEFVFYVVESSIESTFYPLPTFFNFKLNKDILNKT